MYRYLFFLIVIIAVSCQAQNGTADNDQRIKEAPIAVELPQTIQRITKTDAEWKAQLSEDEFYVLRQKGTERSFTGPFVNNKKKGVYTCGGCQLPLFTSYTKFKSGTGWPSFWEPVADRVIKEDTDYVIGYARTEVMCARCDGHLGHVFPDGPKPTGLRYCINGAALDFIEEKEEVAVNEKG